MSSRSRFRRQPLNVLVRTDRVAHGLTESHLTQGMLRLPITARDRLVMMGKIAPTPVRRAWLRQHGLIDEYGRVTSYGRKLFDLPKGATIKTLAPKGHWPKHKRRSDIQDYLRLEFLRALDRAMRQRSKAEVCALLGVDRKNLWKWMTGRMWPTTETAQAAIDKLSRL